MSHLHAWVFCSFHWSTLYFLICSSINVASHQSNIEQTGEWTCSVKLNWVTRSGTLWDEIEKVKLSVALYWSFLKHLLSFSSHTSYLCLYSTGTFPFSSISLLSTRFLNWRVKTLLGSYPQISSKPKAQWENRSLTFVVLINPSRLFYVILSAVHDASFFQYHSTFLMTTIKDPKCTDEGLGKLISAEIESTLNSDSCFLWKALT